MKAIVAIWHDYLIIVLNKTSISICNNYNPVDLSSFSTNAILSTSITDLTSSTTSTMSASTAADTIPNQFDFQNLHHNITAQYDQYMNSASIMAQNDMKLFLMSTSGVADTLSYLDPTLSTGVQLTDNAFNYHIITRNRQFFTI